jgi:hypothetical protein
LLVLMLQQEMSRFAQRGLEVGYVEAIAAQQTAVESIQLSHLLSICDGQHT